MIHSATPVQTPTVLDADIVRQLPDGAVSVETVDGNLVLRASDNLQQRFEELLERRKVGGLTAEEAKLYDAICQLDHALSWLNRLARTPRRG
jgi:hypothetical protein